MPSAWDLALAEQFHLTPRQMDRLLKAREILRLMNLGYKAYEAAAQVGIANGTSLHLRKWVRRMDDARYSAIQAAHQQEIAEGVPF